MGAGLPWCASKLQSRGTVCAEGSRAFAGWRRKVLQGSPSGHQSDSSLEGSGWPQGGGAVGLLARTRGEEQICWWLPLYALAIFCSFCQVYLDPDVAPANAVQWRCQASPAAGGNTLELLKMAAVGRRTLLE